MAKPPRLYKYQPFSPRSIENLKNQVVYFGSPRAFNDPFDCALSPQLKVPTDDDLRKLRDHWLATKPFDESQRNALKAIPFDELRSNVTQTVRKTLRESVDKFSTTQGVTCFAERPNNLLMWSHYADHHRGFCLEFRTDVPDFGKLRQVTYSDQMPEIDPVRMLIDDEYEEFLSLFCTKAQDWQYEREWRGWHKEAGTAYTYPAEALTGVYFGARASFTSFEIVALILAGQNEEVGLWEGSRSEDSFSIVFEQKTYTSYLNAKRRGLIP
ncbi:DUF2971 domain-containing protein [Ramlibacter montanisoli]|uniref:DUF2971 domain-containing protein n=1 Tax=Ramlibacter montanisoli TaxID=2732512 RepID=A0A849KFC9_9BURK|nr:DUF2971 domain-containing protein [Ramlibacter montanisoli]NNU45234.1 DUF2971 domain-containing protein [Ramlibacter montanisoli]